MEEEALPIVRELGLSPVEKPFGRRLPMKVWSGTRDGGRAVLIWSGRDRRNAKISNIGTQPAAVSTFALVDRFSPNLILNVGTAGGFASEGATLGDIYISRGAFRYHDRHIPLDGYNAYGIGGYQSADLSRVAADLNLKIGEISTGDSFRLLDTDWESFKVHRPAVKEMEAAAVAWVATITETPMAAVKGIVDLVDHDSPSEVQFEQNLSTLTEQLAQSTRRVVEYCLGAAMSDLGAGL